MWENTTDKRARAREAKQERQAEPRHVTRKADRQPNPNGSITSTSHGPKRMFSFTSVTCRGGCIFGTSYRAGGYPHQGIVLSIKYWVAVNCGPLTGTSGYSHVEQHQPWSRMAMPLPTPCKTDEVSPASSSCFRPMTCPFNHTQGGKLFD